MYYHTDGVTLYRYPIRLEYVFAMGARDCGCCQPALIRANHALLHS